MKEFDKLAKKLSYIKRAKKEFPKEITGNGKYANWYKEIVQEACREANDLCVMYLLAPFRLHINAPNEEFDELFKSEMMCIKSALKESDIDKFKALLDKAYQDNMVWVVLHGGMATTPKRINREDMALA